MAIIVTAIATEKTYGATLNTVYPGLTENEEIFFSHRTINQQALFQLMGLGTSLGIAIVGGVITGKKFVKNFKTRKSKNE